MARLINNIDAIMSPIVTNGFIDVNQNHDEPSAAFIIGDLIDPENHYYSFTSTSILDSLEWEYDESTGADKSHSLIEVTNIMIDSKGTDNSLPIGIYDVDILRLTDESVKSYFMYNDDIRSTYGNRSCIFINDDPDSRVAGWSTDFAG